MSTGGTGLTAERGAVDAEDGLHAIRPDEDWRLIRHPYPSFPRAARLGLHRGPFRRRDVDRRVRERQGAVRRGQAAQVVVVAVGNEDVGDLGRLDAAGPQRVVQLAALGEIDPRRAGVGVGRSLSEI